MKPTINKPLILFALFVITSIAFSQTYVGSDACAACHGSSDASGAGYNIHAAFLESGHPYKLNAVSGATPSYPWSSVPNPPTDVYMEGGTDSTDFTWNDITYVIGGYGWKARFLDSLGYVVTGYNVQYNLETTGWGKYHQTEALGTKKYNCGRCHTTGWVDSDDSEATNNQDGLAGLVGTFSEPGIRCEACHGPGGSHVVNPSSTNIEKDVSSELCGTCHYRDSEHRIEYKSGFIRHHEQYDELLHSPHSASLTCNTCHNPHASTVYDDLAAEEGVKIDCGESCHATEEATMNHNVNATCVDCHMPEASKSAVKSSIYDGDVKTHIFSINTDPVPMDSMVYIADNGKTYVREDANGKAAVTLDYTCYGCHTDPEGNGGGGSVKTLEELAAFASFIHVSPQEDYVGSGTCMGCHNSTSDPSGATYKIYDTFMESGHPYKLNPVSGAPPVYPWSSVPNTPTHVYMEGGTDTTDFTWDDVTYIIGGYGWKARFLDTLGYVVTGYNVQYNLETTEWSKYHHTEAIGTKKYNCGRCHTTGWFESDDDDATNNQDGLEGLVGTFSEPGVRCEACHGPGVEHVQAPSSSNIIKDPSSELCGNCHYRDSEHRIEYKSGFIRHHEQYDELLHSPHYANLTCNTCHNPHASTVYDDQAAEEGVKMECATCHTAQAELTNHVPLATCTDCHMPEASKSAVAETVYNGDVKTHIFKINVDPVPMDSMVYVADNGKSYVRTDVNGIAAVTLDYVCYTCHNDQNSVGGGGSTKSLAELSARASVMHEDLAIDPLAGIPSEFYLAPNYPNPFNPTTIINFGLVNDTKVTLIVYDLKGHEVTRLVDGHFKAGNHIIRWNGTTTDGKPLATGIYFARMITSSFTKSIKMVMIE